MLRDPIGDPQHPHDHQQSPENNENLPHDLSHTDRSEKNADANLYAKYSCVNEFVVCLLFTKGNVCLGDVIGDSGSVNLWALIGVACGCLCICYQCMASGRVGPWWIACWLHPRYFVNTRHRIGR